MYETVILFLYSTATFCFCDLHPASTASNHMSIGKGTAKHIVHIGIDGLKSSCLLNATDGANNILLRIGSLGSCTLINGRTAIEAVSAPGWCAHLCSLDSSDSGITNNYWIPPWSPYRHSVSITPVTGANDTLPTVFKTIKAQDASIKTAMFYDWKWLSYLGNASVPGTLNKDFFCDPDVNSSRKLCDLYIYGNASTYLNSTLKKTQKSYTFIYFGNLDEVGHTRAWCSQAYEDELHRIDEYIGGLIDLITSSETSNETVVILSTDHGGEPGEYNHGHQDDNCVIVPIFFRGPHIKKNHVMKYKMHVMDIAPTALHSLGLLPNEYWQGQINFDIFE